MIKWKFQIYRKKRRINLVDGADDITCYCAEHKPYVFITCGTAAGTAAPNVVFRVWSIDYTLNLRVCPWVAIFAFQQFIGVRVADHCLFFAVPTDAASQFQREHGEQAHVG